MTNVIIHYHVFKNAGSSIDALLSEALGESWVSWDPGEADSVYGPRDVIRFLRANSHVRALSSHTLRPPTPILTAVGVHPIVFLRHPILRAPSVYKYDRSLEGETERQRVAKHSSFADYVRWCLSNSDEVPIFCDFQTLYLSAEQLRFEDPRAARADRLAFLRATELIEQLNVFGIVERFGESVAQYSSRLAHLFPEIAWREVHENVTGAELGTLEEIEAALGPEIYQRLVEANGYDLALYNRALQIFESRLANAV